jgi:rSAM/selenodomain-associated transferase 2
MISAVIPTLNSEATLAATLEALIPAVVEGVVRDVIIADGGSTDRTLQIAEQSGAQVVNSALGRGLQLRAGAAQAKMSWLLFVHGDTVLENGWHNTAEKFINEIARGGRPDQAAAFRFRLDDSRFRARALEAAVELRASLFKLPYGDQGLLVSRALYDEIGGYTAQPIMEDVDLVRRLGRRRVHMLSARALTSARRFREDGYIRRIVRNQRCLLMYRLGVSPERIAKVYGR